MIFRVNPLMARAAQEQAFRWRMERDQKTAMRDLTWEFAEPDQYPELVAQQKPGMLAAKAEKEFQAAVATGDPAAIRAAARQHPKYTLAANTIAGLLLLETELEAGLALLEEVGADEHEVLRDQFIRKYLPEAGLSVVIAAGLTARLPLQRNSIVLLLAELYQAQGQPDRALQLLQATEQTTHVRLSQSELLYEAERYEEVLDVTSGVVNDDDFTALMLAYRGRALGELGRDDQAIGALAAVLEYPNRAEAIKAIALVGRGMINQARGEHILARNDYTQALIEVPHDPEAQDHIEELIHGSLGPS